MSAALDEEAAAGSRTSFVEHRSAMSNVSLKP
jgi:hypothetical protein